LYKSAKRGKSVKIDPVEKTSRPTLKQQIQRPPVSKPKVVKAEAPSR
jgi:glucose-fructose oxidoreductase